ncbi:MAG: hypothetical protein NZ957_05785 [Thaumarchaeota archaeon]|nr:hypothetical protein [Candidatus Calditenuaceae archaeon]
MNDVITLRFVKTTRGYIARSDEGIIILLATDHQIHQLLMERPVPHLTLNVKIVKIVERDFKRYAIAWPLDDENYRSIIKELIAG